jgi:hypothetical protein
MLSGGVAMTMTISLDTLISLIALLVSIGSAIYTWHFNHYRIQLVQAFQSTDEEQVRIDFSIMNLSTRPIEILNVSLSRHGVPIHDNGFNPNSYREAQFKAEQEQRKLDRKKQMRLFGSIASSNGAPSSMPPRFDPYGESNNFDGPLTLVPNESEDLSYFVDQIPTDIVITCDRRIHCFRRTQSFVPHLHKHD